MITKKIIAIGGGGNGRLKPDGTKLPYELANQDREIVRLAKDSRFAKTASSDTSLLSAQNASSHPHFLLLAHAKPLAEQDLYYKTMVDLYGELYDCSCRHLKSDRLQDKEYARACVDWADIIFECGGNTLDMVALWQKTGFATTLRHAYEKGKVMCGVSAGANCWFSECSSDSLKIKHGDSEPLIGVKGLGFIDALFVPHCDEPGRLEHAKALLKGRSLVGVAVSNCAALEVVGDQYRLITGDASRHNIIAHGLKLYWRGDTYFQEAIDSSPNFKPLSELINK